MIRRTLIREQWLHGELLENEANGRSCEVVRSEVPFAIE